MKWADVEKYHYELPQELIRTEGVEPRDSARLFVYDTKTDTVTLDVFKNLAKYLPEESLLVLNNTRVLPARLWLQKETGGKIEVFVLLNQIIEAGPQYKIPVLVDRKVVIGQKLLFPGGETLEVVDQDENIFYITLPGGKAELYVLLEKYGETPVPHYLEDITLNEETLRERYQTIFAKDTINERASVAAPTASLHFTERVFESLVKKNITQTSLTLDVGLGTFAPLSEQAFDTGRLHKEYVEVTEEVATRLNQTKEHRQKVIAVGTTVTRTLEAISKSGRAEAYQGPVDIFLYPPHQFQMVDILVTNFHLPKTSLMLLVDAFLQDKGSKRGVVSLYEEAIREKFSFYSFGDSMLIL
ncbi:MAG: tRNA preQ1(34) S-adenosylmethionine ribosyltransferase-isomerase QueA [Candidatus Moranbacteria bacterium]|nr:tRNA preQ1(34) S-adenosylmethionine ribosyltransferase-isomerase QueA [Candidatus Moranbacteria bacterium]